MGNSDSIQYQVVVLVFSNGLAILGELGKLVPVSEGRIAAVHLINNATTLVLELLGTPQEVVEITFASSGSSKSSSKISRSSGGGDSSSELAVESVQCTVGPSGTVAMHHYPTKKSKCAAV